MSNKIQYCKAVENSPKDKKSVKAIPCDIAGNPTGNKEVKIKKSS